MLRLAMPSVLGHIELPLSSWRKLLEQKERSPGFMTDRQNIAVGALDSDIWGLSS